MYPLLYLEAATTECIGVLFLPRICNWVGRGLEQVWLTDYLWVECQPVEWLTLVQHWRRVVQKPDSVSHEMAHESRRRRIQVPVGKMEFG
jgi:hypothetical protein